MVLSKSISLFEVIDQFSESKKVSFSSEGKISLGFQIEVYRV